MDLGPGIPEREWPGLFLRLGPRVGYRPTMPRHARSRRYDTWDYYAFPLLVYGVPALLFLCWVVRMVSE